MFCPKLLEEFVADSHVALDGVVVVELFGVVGVWLVAESFCGVDQGAKKFRRELSVFRGDDAKVGAEETHGLQFFAREAVGGDWNEWIALDGADERERTAGAASGVLDDAHAGSQLAAR